MNNVSIKSEEKLFTLNDLRNAFIAGSEFESAYIDDEDQTDVPDFGDYVKECFDIDIN